MYVIKLNRIITFFAVILTAIVITFNAHNAVQSTASITQSVKVPILMYHSIFENSGNNKYIVSPADFESDLKFLNENAYTTIVMQDLIDYVYSGKALPQKPVVLTFDDGFYNNYAYVYPLLKQYNAKAVISIVGAYTDTYTENNDTNVNYAHLSWDNVREMSESGFVEIQNHTYDFHSLDKGRKGCKRNKGESVEKYTALLTKDIGSLQEKCIEKLGSAPTTFTYPYGFISDESLDIIKALGFKASLSCEEGINELERNPEQLYRMKRCIRTPACRAADILKE